jgi:hypothetical protein
MLKADPNSDVEDPAVVTEAATAVAIINAIVAMTTPNVRCISTRNINTSHSEK